jgi:hypothetical protein
MRAVRAVEFDQADEVREAPFSCSSRNRLNEMLVSASA